MDSALSGYDPEFGVNSQRRWLFKLWFVLSAVMILNFAGNRSSWYVPVCLLLFVVGLLPKVVSKCRQIHVDDALHAGSRQSNTRRVRLEHLQVVDSDQPFVCPLCLQNKEVGTAVIQLPCSHLFCAQQVSEGDCEEADCEQGDCAGIQAWLRRHSSCPVCREEVMERQLDEQRWETDWEGME
mmetsp:Transcript_120535/g.225283  ORF Transcript_120535/g.225283 Transcript_120535/m.225283 type:complete len:182 (+) Transcript_120535:72-617(+)